MQALPFVEFEILAGVEHVESGDPGPDRQAEQERFGAKLAAGCQVTANSRMAVRGLRASIRASTTRLKPMAALRAAIMHATIHTTRDQSKPLARMPSNPPTSANGSANTEWLKRTNDPYVRRRDSMKTSGDPADCSRGHAADEVFFHIAR